MVEAARGTQGSVVTGYRPHLCRRRHLHRKKHPCLPLHHFRRPPRPTRVSAPTPVVARIRHTLRLEPPNPRRDPRSRRGCHPIHRTALQDPAPPWPGFRDRTFDGGGKGDVTTCYSPPFIHRARQYLWSVEVNRTRVGKPGESR